jgi:hypothetical protein
MNELEEKSIQNKITEINDTSKSKKLQKQLNRKKADTKKQILAIESSQTEHKNNIHANIKANIQSIGKENSVTEENIVEQINNMYVSIFTSLKNLQANIRKEVNALYLPLTKADREIIDRGNASSIKAKALIEKEREDLINPINIKLGDYIKEKEAEKHKKIDAYNKQIHQVKDVINKLKKRSSKQSKRRYKTTNQTIR